ncbi:hypothetical protein O181_115565 [Austropuccinia psidii MF-1]|uniref:Uncharacterized protein n=1 Tax=Austropuccinia psidii MF-1 TaxID=1389203 RepID=A0A9Q3K6P6_9BASI|nr:hypothetical protein [Austropuccinia psidii MF-1]
MANLANDYGYGMDIPYQGPRGWISMVVTLMVITKGTRQFRLLEERATRIKENQAAIQATEEQLNQTGPTLILPGSQGVDQPNSPVASHHPGTRRSVAKSHHLSQYQVFPRRRQGNKGKNKPLSATGRKSQTQ